MLVSRALAAASLPAGAGDRMLLAARCCPSTRCSYLGFSRKLLEFLSVLFLS